jgi:hypothetical protein
VPFAFPSKGLVRSFQNYRDAGRDSASKHLLSEPVLLQAMFGVVDFPPNMPR